MVSKDKIESITLNRGDILPLIKVLKEKYPDEDIDRIIEEQDFQKLEELIFTQ